VVETIRPLIHDAQLARGLFAEVMAGARPLPGVAKTVRAASGEAPIDPERVRAAITLALDAALPELVREITERVLVALGH
jgi:hypothetical protein